MRFLRHGLLGIFIATTSMVLLVMALNILQTSLDERANRDVRRTEARELTFAVNVITARSETIAPILAVFGEIQTRRRLEIRTATSGQIVELSPDFVEGGRVEKGQVLIRLDPADAQLEMDRILSDLHDGEAEQRAATRATEIAHDEVAAAQDQVELRERSLERQQDLAKRGVGAAAAVETAELALSSARQAVLARRQALAQAETRVDQAYARLARTRISEKEARRRLDDLVIRAAFSGTLGQVAVVEGRRVNQNERLAELIDPEALEVAIRLSTAQFVRLLDDQGQLAPARISVVLDVFGTALRAQGQLDRSSGSVAEGQTGRLIFARLANARGFKPGDFVSVEISEAPLEQVARLPATAIDAGNTVLALGAEDRLESLPVTLLRRQSDDILVEADGLSGREIVSQRTPVLGAGIKVRPLRQVLPGAVAAAPAAPEMLELTDDHRSRLVAIVEGNTRMPATVRERILAQLAEAQVPVRLVERLEARAGG